jgi:hypothetical protein
MIPLTRYGEDQIRSTQIETDVLVKDLWRQVDRLPLAVG